MFTKLLKIYAIKTITIIFTKYMGCENASINVTPKYPQKYTRNGLDTKRHTKYFLGVISLTPATIFTRNAGVKGNASITAILLFFKFLKVMEIEK